MNSAARVRPLAVPGTAVGVDWRKKLGEVPEHLSTKRVAALAWQLHCLDHRLEAAIESADHLHARRARLVERWEAATSSQLRLFDGGRS